MQRGSGRLQSTPTARSHRQPLPARSTLHSALLTTATGLGAGGGPRRARRDPRSPLPELSSTMRPRDGHELWVARRSRAGAQPLVGDATAPVLATGPGGGLAGSGRAVAALMAAGGSPSAAARPPPCTGGGRVGGGVRPPAPAPLQGSSSSCSRRSAFPAPLPAPPRGLKFCFTHTFPFSFFFCFFFCFSFGFLTAPFFLHHPGQHPTLPASSSPSSQPLPSFLRRGAPGDAGTGLTAAGTSLRGAPQWGAHGGEAGGPKAPPQPLSKHRAQRSPPAGPCPSPTLCSRSPPGGGGKGRGLQGCSPPGAQPEPPSSSAAPNTPAPASPCSPQAATGHQPP